MSLYKSSDLWDLGVSSVHFGISERWFSFRFDGPLDMRLDTSSGETAGDLVNTLSYEKNGRNISDIWRWASGRIYRKKIIEHEIYDRLQLQNNCRNRAKSMEDSVTTIFQALRIAVNKG